MIFPNSLSLQAGLETLRLPAIWLSLAVPAYLLYVYFAPKEVKDVLRFIRENVNITSISKINLGV